MARDNNEVDIRDMLTTISCNGEGKEQNPLTLHVDKLAIKGISHTKSSEENSLKSEFTNTS